jgi:membrane-bound lytic murein transglycosylase D
MLLKKSIAIALLATSSLVNFSTANAADSFLEAANSLLNEDEITVSRTYNNTLNQGADLKSVAALLGVHAPEPQVNRSKSTFRPRQQTVRYTQPRQNNYQVSKSRQQRLLNKRKRENLQRLRNQKRRLNHKKQLLRLQASRRNYGAKKANVYQRSSAYQRTSSVSRLPANSVWHRVKNGFRLRNDQYRPIVKRAINRMKGHRAGLIRTLNRSSNYLHFVTTELQKRGMPTDLVLLPMVESAYVTRARSHAGAAGMWQFIRSTGKRYGLKQTRGYDGRLDVINSTRAAMDYLQKLHRQFHGDWLLALAAYNCGENRVEREINKNKARGLPTDYWNLSLPNETKNYVPKLLAYREVIRSPQSFGIRLPNVVNAPKLVQVHINKAVDLRKVAYSAGVKPSIVTRLNPGYKYGITMPSMTRKILVPRQYAGSLQRAIQRAPTVSRIQLASYRKATKSYRKKSRRSYRFKKKRIIRHRVRRGENLVKIASRYGTTVRKIKRLNRLRGSRITIGKRLIIATKSRSKSKSRKSRSKRS